LIKIHRTWRQSTVKNIPHTVVAAINMPITVALGIRSRRYSRIIAGVRYSTGGPGKFARTGNSASNSFSLALVS
jgi:hypothetical protein